ncbi:HlyD family type I secretion periplasmic adaptor subunit [Methylobacterium sp. E-016]|jgi:HlyD family secretion protein|uniref:HlyD family type I secretion periplasmic adaptor subunit n=1 Tax=Methylobacterium sp. E-016 TaxID=2836556 RepID=UPI001FBBB181|nr:HlyD family type I secretion periplasmic adaptor subunit [Methylobacterium sp. E-016]MCJ2078134.1 HlyD family type I secretion periplasmic adaptor subunit [Methylobacterium sp. E-016]
MSIKLPALRARLTSTTAKVQQGLTRTSPVVAEGDSTGANLRPAKPPRLTTWKHHAVAGYALIFSTFGVMGAWAAVARLDRAVVSPGTIAVENSRKVVQHFEGGMVREVLVKEGQTVHEGDLVLRLDPIQANASVDLFRSQLDATLVQEARLLAERDGQNNLELPPEILARRTEPAVARVIADQTAQLKERRGSLVGQIELLESRVRQLKNEISGVTVEKAATEQQVGFINQELVGLRQLREKNLIPMNRLLSMERERTRLEGIIGRSVADMAKAENGINETGLQITQLRQKLQEDIAGQLLEARQKSAELREKFAVAQDVLRRLEVRAPRSGVVQNLKVYTIGQVVRSAEPLMEIVPDDDKLVVHVQFAPNDLETVHAGMPAEIKFPSFHSRRIPTILGNLETVSRDRLIDETTRQPYFLGIVQISKLQIPEMMQGRLVAGMPAEVIVTTGERTALSYVVSPFFEALGHSFNEH